MKKLLSLFVLSLLFVSQTFAYRDVPQNSSVYPAVNWMLEQGYYEDGSFFRPDSPVPADMFWQLAIAFSGFNPDSATFNTIMPEGVSETAPNVQYLREAVRRGFLSNKRSYNGLEEVSRIEALRILLDIKALKEPQYVSDQFKDVAGNFAPGFKGATAFEAGLAAGFLTEKDVQNLRPYISLTRRDFVQWLYNYSLNGSKEISLDENYRPRTSRQPITFNYQERLETPEEDPNEPAEDDIQTIKLTTTSGQEIDLKVADIQNRRLPDEEVLRQVYLKILNSYRFQSELTDEKKTEIVNAGIAGMVKALDDKYSSYVEPVNHDEFEESLNGKFEGIGAYVEMIDDDFTITAPIHSSPAEAAGLMPGDVVVQVDEEKIDDLSVNEIVRLIKGPAGTEVVLKIRRDGALRDYTVTRAKITVPSVTFESKQGIPVIKINTFGRETAGDFAQILNKEVLSKNPRGLILDLRNNPGGFLTSAVDIGEFFVKKDELLFIVDERTTQKRYVSSRDGELANFNKPIVVLVNKGTASASEIISGLLQDYGKATIIGSKTVGKGTVQNVIEYENGGALKLTIAKWLTPKERWIQADEENLGIIPEIMMEDQTPEERRAGIDKPLERAVNKVLGR